MDFIKTAYVFLVPILFFLSWFIKKDFKFFIINLLIVANLLQLFYSLFFIKELYNYYQLAKIIGFDFFPNNRINLGWQETRILLIIFLPFLFLIKKISSDKLLSICVFFLLIFDEIKKLIFSKSSSLNFSLINFSTQNLLLNLMNYISCFIFMYTLLWFLKRLSHQQSKL